MRLRALGRAARSFDYPVHSKRILEFTNEILTGVTGREGKGQLRLASLEFPRRTN